MEDERDSLFDQERRGHKETRLLMDLAGLFTRGNVTGEQGLLVLEGAEALLRENKKSHPNGGMFATLAQLYSDKELPIPLMERVLVHCLESTFWRENASTQLLKAIKFMRSESLVDLSRPWRECLGQLFDLKAQAKAEGKKSLRSLRSRFSDVSESELDEGESL